MTFSFPCKFVNIIVHNKPRFCFSSFISHASYKRAFRGKMKTKVIITEHMFFVKLKIKIYSWYEQYHNGIKYSFLYSKKGIM